MAVAAGVNPIIAPPLSAKAASVQVSDLRSRYRFSIRFAIFPLRSLRGLGPNQDHHSLRRGIKYSALVSLSETCPRHVGYAGVQVISSEGQTRRGVSTVIESAADDEVDRVTSPAQLGSLLRRLRGSKTQQNIADHARRHNFSVHRPDLSAIERGHRLPTANELRGILHGCGCIDLFDSFDGIRQRLLAELADPQTSNGQPHPVSHPAPGNPDDSGLPLRSRGPDHAGRRNLVIALSTAAAVVITTVVVLTSGVANTSLQPAGRDSSRSGTPASQLDVQAAIAAAREAPLCAEALVPDPGVAPTVLAQDTGPADAVIPNRLVELRAYSDSQYGWIAWAHLTKSASSRDRLWVDWSYLPEPTERNQWRQCTPQPISAGPDSPAIRAVDSDGGERWFRACGQAPPEDRPPDSKRKSFCTSWVPVLP